MERKFIDSIILNENIDRDSYLYHLPIVKYLMKNKSLSLKNDVTFLVGENGTGKSTLLEAIAIAYGFNAEGGTKNFNFSTNSTHSELYNSLTISKSKFAKDGFFLRAESFYNVATNIDELDKELPLLQSYGGISLHKQSHGESFLALIQNRFLGNGIYILDEPEAALSPLRILTLIAEIDRLVKNNSQFIIATHSPILMTFPNACIYQFTENQVETVSYEQTEHYQLTKRYLENPEQMLKYLLED
ncbi:AAA family ATPase [Anaerovorax sp. IOR16]|uniref:AAA family ATPase n=1 Tax=Anaerovorax sp. IOR16 TaxID=2773458 RepID=UPI001FD71D66|nr:AAA family ATPase [Anaerovorax sp. IOR16]